MEFFWHETQGTMLKFGSTSPPRYVDVRKKLKLDTSSEHIADPTSKPCKVFGFRNGRSEIEYEDLTRKIKPSNIPIPKFVVIDYYEQMYKDSFIQPHSYIQTPKQVACETTSFCEYDLDDSDDDWLEYVNNYVFYDTEVIKDDTFERLLYELELLDFQNRANVEDDNCISTSLELDAALPKLRHVSKKAHEIKAAYNYWKAKRRRWKKPILRRLRPQTKAEDEYHLHSFHPYHRQVEHWHGHRYRALVFNCLCVFVFLYLISTINMVIW